MKKITTADVKAFEANKTSITITLTQDEAQLVKRILEHSDYYDIANGILEDEDDSYGEQAVSVLEAELLTTIQAIIDNKFPKRDRLVSILFPKGIEAWMKEAYA